MQNKLLNSHYPILILLICFVCLSVQAQDSPSLRVEDKVRIKEAQVIAKKYGDAIWKEFSQTPFTILLVTDEYEFLINHPYPSDEFESLGKDDYLDAEIYYRQQQYNKSFLATFPAVNGVNCIVIGTPENTQLNSTAWIITLLHEHFHQYQFNSPHYFQDLAALGLDNGDETGMWQLNYPFPYEDPEVVKVYESYTQQLKHTVEDIDSDRWTKNYQKLLKKRNHLKDVLSENDYKYLSFQWYQEGVARYTEYALLELLREHIPSQDVLAISDFVEYDEFIEDFYATHLNNVTNLKIDEHQRLTVYDVGFAETLIIRKKNPSWANRYLTEKFDLFKLH